MGRIMGHNKELYNLYFALNIIKSVRWAGHVAVVLELRNACNALFGKKRRLGGACEDGSVTVRRTLNTVVGYGVD
jgi:hypothetical protein